MAKRPPRMRRLWTNLALGLWEEMGETSVGMVLSLTGWEILEHAYPFCCSRSSDFKGTHMESGIDNGWEAGRCRPVGNDRDHSVCIFVTPTSEGRVSALVDLNLHSSLAALAVLGRGNESNGVG